MDKRCGYTWNMDTVSANTRRQQRQQSESSPLHSETPGPATRMTDQALSPLLGDDDLKAGLLELVESGIRAKAVTPSITESNGLNSREGSHR